MKYLKQNLPADTVKYLVGLFLVTAFRFIPRPPNFQPLLATTMPFAKHSGISGGVLFALLAVLVFDFSTGLVGLWTLVTLSTYSLIALFAALYFKNRPSSVKHYLIFSVFATLFFDFVTGPLAGSLLFKQPFWVSFTGQIPFTIYHLVGNITLGCLLSPLVYRWVANNPELRSERVLALATTD